MWLGHCLVRVNSLALHLCKGGSDIHVVDALVECNSKSLEIIRGDQFSVETDGSHGHSPKFEFDLDSIFDELGLTNTTVSSFFRGIICDLEFSVDVGSSLVDGIPVYHYCHRIEERAILR